MCRSFKYHCVLKRFLQFPHHHDQCHRCQDPFHDLDCLHHPDVTNTARHGYVDLVKRFWVLQTRCHYRMSFGFLTQGNGTIFPMILTNPCILSSLLKWKRCGAINSPTMSHDTQMGYCLRWSIMI